MGFKEVIIDTDICIKIGSIQRYNFLEILLPLVADHILMHRVVREELLSPQSAIDQIEALIKRSFITIYDPSELDPMQQDIYASSISLLKNSMWNPRNPKKNLGEIHSLALAKALGVPIFMTDEVDLQEIIDYHLNTNDSIISCFRIIDIIQEIKQDRLQGMARKQAKLLWVLSGKNKDDFDRSIWPL